MSVFFFLFMLNFTKGGGYMVVQSIYLNKDNVLKESWQELIDYICKYNGTFRKFKIVIEISSNKVKYYLVTKYKVPPTINSIAVSYTHLMCIRDSCLCWRRKTKSKSECY